MSRHIRKPISDSLPESPIRERVDEFSPVLLFCKFFTGTVFGLFFIDGTLLFGGAFTGFDGNCGQRIGFSWLFDALPLFWSVSLLAVAPLTCGVLSLLYWRETLGWVRDWFKRMWGLPD